MNCHCIAWMLVLLSAGALAHTCKTSYNIKLINPTKYSNGTVESNGEFYSPGQYVRKMQEGKDETSRYNDEYFYCICDVKTCIRKCCKEGWNLDEAKACVKRKDKKMDLILNVTDTEGKIALKDLKINYTLINGFDGDVRPNGDWTFLSNYNLDFDGKIRTDSKEKTYEFDDFCVDLINEKEECRVLVRNDPKVEIAPTIPAVPTPKVIPSKQSAPIAKDENQSITPNAKSAASGNVSSIASDVIVKSSTQKPTTAVTSGNVTAGSVKNSSSRVASVLYPIFLIFLLHPVHSLCIF